MGIVLKTTENPDDYWLTADGGQHDCYYKGQAAEIVPRPRHCENGHIYLAFGAEEAGSKGGHRLYGWIGLHNKQHVAFANEIFDGTCSQQSYNDFLARMDTVLENKKEN